MGYASGTMDVTSASREELIALVAQLQATVQRLEERIRELEGGGGRPKGMPGLKPGARPARPDKPPRKKRAVNCARRRLPPTRRVTHAAAHCPGCGAPLCGGTPKRTREVIELPPPAPVVVTEHVYLERRCPDCRKRVVPPAGLPDAALGRQRLGVGLVSLIATLREEARLPVRTIQWYLRTFHALQVSVGAIVGALRQVAARGQAALARLREQIRGSPWVHADETGWREAGANGYAWIFCTPTARYFLRRGRDKGAVDEVLGADFAGVLVSDCYAAYDHYPGVKQRCWAHLLRDIHDVRVAHPADAALGAWATAVRRLYERAVAFASPDEPARRQAEAAFAAELGALCRPYREADEAAAPQAPLCRRLLKHLAELFVFVGDPDVPPDNNEAERGLRHLVTCREISGGTRSAEGSDTKMALASLFGTWRVQGQNPYTACRHLLTSTEV